MASVVCNDWEHILSCKNSSYFVRPFCFESSDNWYQTKSEFTTSANALFLSDYQKVYCFQYCLLGLAKTKYIETLKELQALTFEHLTAALDSKFQFFHPLRSVNLQNLKMKEGESVGEFSLRVELAARDLFYLSYDVQNQLIYDSFLSGITENLREFVLDQAVVNPEAAITFTKLIDLCKKYEHMVWYKTNSAHISKARLSKNCFQCDRVILILSNQSAPVFHNESKLELYSQSNVLEFSVEMYEAEQLQEIVKPAVAAVKIHEVPPMHSCEIHMTPIKNFTQTKVVSEGRKPNPKPRKFIKNQKKFSAKANSEIKPQINFEPQLLTISQTSKPIDSSDVDEGYCSDFE